MNARRLISEKSLWQSYKRQSIQEAVIRLMCREGLKSVTMERVAQEVGIAKGTVYLHYHDKKELLDEVKQSALAPLMVALEVILRSGDPVAVAIHKMAVGGFRHVPIVDRGEATGVVSARDVFRHLAAGLG